MAQITITTTAQQDVRIQAAFRVILNLDHDPSTAEIKANLISYLRSQVFGYETNKNFVPYVPPPLDPT